MIENKKRIIIDTDPGIDDALALLLAAASPELILEGITVVHGNCSLRQALRNALAVVELAGLESLPVCSGLEVPLVQPSLLAPETHGNTGLGYADLPEPRLRAEQEHAVDFLIRKALENPGEISLIAIGPLTNLAMAVRRAPEIIPAIPEVIIMGGALLHQGNTTPLAEFNTYVDPHAAHIVYHSGLPITLIPLDVTYRCLLTAEDVQRLQESASPVASFIAESTRFYMDFHHDYQQIRGCVINDPLALAVSFQPELVETKPLYVDVDLSGGVSMGKTFGDFYDMSHNEANMRVALDVKPRQFIELFLNRIQKLC